MRQFLAVAFLGATLASGASAAFAGDQVDYVPSYQRTQSEPIVSRVVTVVESRESAVAGGSITATSVYRQLRLENIEGRR